MAICAIFVVDVMAVCECNSPWRNQSTKFMFDIPIVSTRIIWL